MRLYLLISLTFLLAFVVTTAKGNEPSSLDDARKIEVLGIAAVSSVPDRFSFSLSLEQKGRQATELNKAITKRTNNVVQALFKTGIEKKHIQSLQVRFNPWVEYNGKVREQKGFTLTRKIEVTLNTLAQYEQAIDTVLKLGINNINEFNYSSSQNEENYQAALQQALLNAKQRATDMAKVLGLKLAHVISISEQSSGELAPVALQSRQFATSESYQAGEMSTKARVKVIFALQNGS